MRRPVILNLGLAAGVTVALLAGCSGAGRAPGLLTQSPAQELAATQMTTVQLLKSWLSVLYPVATTPPGQPEIHHEFLDPDTMHLWGVDSHGRAFDYLTHTDGSGSGTWSEPNGVAVTGTWGPLTQPVPRTYVRDMVYQYPGMTLSYRSTTVQPAGGGFAAVTREGRETLSDGRELDFRTHCDGVGAQSLHLQLPAEGQDVTLQVPIAIVVGNWRPAAGQPATGVAASPGGAQSLALQGVDGDWQQWQVTAADGTAATFALGPGMSGSGRLERAGALLGVLNWTESLQGRLDLTNLTTVEVAPLAAARDLAIDRWLKSLVGLSPGTIQ